MVYKQGREIPTSVKRAYELDDLLEQTLWRDAIEKELATMEKNKVFRILTRGQRAPYNYQFAPLHMVFDIKADGTHKARFVAGGHIVDSSGYAAYASVVKTSNFRILMTLAEREQLQMITGDIGGAYLNADAKEYVYSRAGDEFKSDKGKVVLIEKALYGLKTSAAAWWEHLAKTLRSIGFKGSRFDDNVWYRARHEGENLVGYDYACIHVDDFALFAKDVQPYISQLSKVYTLRHVTPIGEDSYYLGMDIVLRPDNLGYGISARTFLKEAMKEVEKIFGHVPEKDCPLDPNFEYELPTTPILNSVQHQHYRKLVGILQWASELERIDITFAARFLARFTAGPLQQHLDGVKYIFGYLKKHIDLIIPIHSSPVEDTPVKVGGEEGQKEIFELMYPDAINEIDASFPVPCYGELPLTCYVDLDSAGDNSNRTHNLFGRDSHHMIF